MTTQIQEIEEELRELAEATEHAANKLAELRKPKLYAMDVFISTRGGECLATSNGRYTVIKTSDNLPSGYCSDNLVASEECKTRLGTFDEVYVKRSEVGDIKQKILDWRDSAGDTVMGRDCWDDELSAFIRDLLK